MGYDGKIVINTAIDTGGVDKGASDIQQKLRSGLKNAAATVKKIGRTMSEGLSKSLSVGQQEADGFSGATKEVRELQAQIEKTSSALELAQKTKEQFLAAGGSPDSSYVQDLDNRIQHLTGTLQEGKGKLAEFGVAQLEPAAATKKAGRIFSWAGKVLGGLKNVMVKATKGGAKLLASAVRGLGERLKKLAWNISKVVLKLMGLNKESKKTGFSISKMLMRALLFRTVFRALSAAVSGIKTGFQNLAQYSSETNSTISLLMSSLTQLKNSLATAFSPILSVVAPILSRFIGLISSAASAVAQFFSALTGKSTYTKAVKVQQDYAASLKKTGSNAKDAKKELEGYLSPLDEINKMEKKDTDISSGSGAGGGEVSPGQMFKEEAITNPIKEIADKIRALFAAEDWQGLGAFMAQCVNAAFAKMYQALSWENVGPEIVHYLTAFIVTFNSFIQNLDWNLIGRTLGTGINTAVNTLSLLVSGIDWGAIGAALSVGLMGLVNEVDWNAFGLLIGSYFMIKWDMLVNFVQGIDWSRIGESIGQALNGAVRAIDLATIGMTLGLAITGICQTAIDFAATFDWIGLGTNIANGINAAIQNIDASTIGKGLSDFSVGFLNMCITALSQVNWSELGNKIGDFIVSVDWLGIAARLAICGVFLIEGLLDGIVGALASIASWMKTHVFDPIVNGFKNLFGIHSPSTVFAEFGHFLIEGLTNGIKDKINSVLQIFQNLKTNLATKWNEIKASAETAWKAIGDATRNIWQSGIVGAIKQSVNSIIGLINRMIEAVTGGVNSIFDKLNTFSVDIPDWVPELGGKHFGFAFQHFKAPKIPYLATGAVIPANAPFTAVLGDQKHGNNIEAPEALIRKIVREESGSRGGTYHFTGQINRRVLFDEFISEAKLRQDQTGVNPLTAF